MPRRNGWRYGRGSAYERRRPPAVVKTFTPGGKTPVVAGVFCSTPGKTRIPNSLIRSHTAFMTSGVVWSR